MVIKRTRKTNKKYIKKSAKMKKITDQKIADFLGLTRQSVYNLKKNKPHQYKVIKSFLLLKENNFFENFKKIKALAELIRQECNSKYIDDLVKLVEEGDEVVEEILKSIQKTL